MRRFNRYAGVGKDRDFGRGEFPFANSVSGDLTHQPNPNLGPLNKPPYYGLLLEPAATGSTGLMTDSMPAGAPALTSTASGTKRDASLVAP